MTKNNGKKYWFNSIKLHDPDFPMSWSAPVSSKKIISNILVFWAIVMLLPWELLAQLPGYSKLISLMNEIFPSISGLSAEARHGGELYSKAQLTAIYFFSVAYLFYVGIFTGNFPEKNKNIPKWTFPLLFLTSGLLFFFCVAVFKSWDGNIDISSNHYFESEWKLTGSLILFWYGVAVLLAISVAAFRTLVSRCHSKLRM